MITCCKDGLLGQSLIVDDGELRQFDVLHSSHRAAVATTLPVELNVVSGVTIWRLENNRGTWSLIGFHVKSQVKGGGENKHVLKEKHYY